MTYAYRDCITVVHIPGFVLVVRHSLLAPNLSLCIALSCFAILCKGRFFVGNNQTPSSR